MLELNDTTRLTYWLGSITVINGILLSLTSNSIFGRTIGEISCQWRVDFSPHRRTFAIWAVIYTLTFVSCMVQIGGGASQELPTLSWSTMYFWSSAWNTVTLWPPIFDREHAYNLGAASVVLIVVTVMACLAIVSERAWRERSTVAILLTAPISLLAGWLMVASALNVAIAWKAAFADPADAIDCGPKTADMTERAYREKRRKILEDDYARRAKVFSPVPVLLAVLVSGVSVLLPDPLLVVPAMWAIVNQAFFPSWAYGLSLLLLVVAAVIAGLRAFVFEVEPPQALVQLASLGT